MVLKEKTSIPESNKFDIPELEIRQGNKDNSKITFLISP